MEFALFLIFFLLSTVLSGVIGYYVNLLFFNKRENYHRDEITRIVEPLLKNLIDLLESGGNLILGSALFFGFGLFSWCWSLLGGIIGTPHYTDSLGNYFFGAPILFLGFIFGYQFLKEGFGVEGIGKQFFDSARPALFGLGLGSWSANLSAWGLYHEFYFIFVFICGVIVLFPLAYLWNGKPFFGFMIGEAGQRYHSEFEENIYDETGINEPNAYESEPASSFTKSTSNQNKVASASWDDIEEGGLGDEAPNFDDFDFDDTK